MNQPQSVVFCPRCEADYIFNSAGSTSRTTRDDGPEIVVCNRCGDAEAFMRVVPYSEWPLTIEALIEEERDRIGRRRRAKLETLNLEDVD